MGVIETLSAGFDLVRRRIWLILVPVLLDVLLWAAPRLSILGLVQDMGRNLAAIVAANPDAAGGLKESLQLLEATAGGMNLLSLLSSGLAGVPTLLIDDNIRFFGLAKTVIEVPGGFGLLALSFGLYVVGLLVGALYLGAIAQQVRDGHNDWGTLWQRLGRHWLRLLAYTLLIFAGVIFVGMPLALVLSLFGFLSPVLASLGMAAVSFVAFWLMIYLAFVPEAIVLGEDGVLRSMLHSMGLVRRHFWSTLGLLLLANIITAGLMFVWRILLRNAAGALLCIVANAFVGTGITAAIFIYYRDRFQAWQMAVRGEEKKA